MRGVVVLGLLTLVTSSFASAGHRSTDSDAPGCLHAAQEETQVRATCSVELGSLTVAIDACWQSMFCEAHDWAETRVWACSTVPGSLVVSRTRDSVQEPSSAPAPLGLAPSSSGCVFAAYWRDLSADDPENDVAFNALSVSATLVPESGAGVGMVVVSSFSG